MEHLQVALGVADGSGLARIDIGTLSQLRQPRRLVLGPEVVVQPAVGFNSSARVVVRAETVGEPPDRGLPR